MKPSLLIVCYAIVAVLAFKHVKYSNEPTAWMTTVLLDFWDPLDTASDDCDLGLMMIRSIELRVLHPNDAHDQSTAELRTWLSRRSTVFWDVGKNARAMDFHRHSGPVFNRPQKGQNDCSPCIPLSLSTSLANCVRAIHSTGQSSSGARNSPGTYKTSEPRVSPTLRTAHMDQSDRGKRSGELGDASDGTATPPKKATPQTLPIARSPLAAPPNNNDPKVGDAANASPAKNLGSAEDPEDQEVNEELEGGLFAGDEASAETTLEVILARPTPETEHHDVIQQMLLIVLFEVAVNLDYCYYVPPRSFRLITADKGNVARFVRVKVDRISAWNKTNGNPIEDIKIIDERLEMDSRPPRKVYLFPLLIINTRDSTKIDDIKRAIQIALPKVTLDYSLMRMTVASSEAGARFKAFITIGTDDEGIYKHLDGLLLTIKCGAGKGFYTEMIIPASGSLEVAGNLTFRVYNVFSGRRDSDVIEQIQKCARGLNIKYYRRGRSWKNGMTLGTFSMTAVNVTEDALTSFASFREECEKDKKAIKLVSRSEAIAQAKSRNQKGK
jgi:hypothetical protein